MPELDPGYADRQAERLRRYDEAMHATDPDDAPHLDALAIARCTLCDDDGYRPNGAVCDHVDRSAIAKRGIARCREALAQKRLPKS